MVLGSLFPHLSFLSLTPSLLSLSCPEELSAPRELTHEPMTTAPSPLVGAGGGGSLDSELYSTSPHTKSLPQPIGRPERTGSASSDSFQRAVGAEVKSKSLEDEGEVYIRKQMQLIDADTSLDESEKQRRKQNLLRLSLGAVGAGFSPEAVPPMSHSLPSSVSDALEAMGMEDLNLEDLDSGPLRDDPQEQMLSGGLLGQSPVAHGFMQSLQQHHHHHHPGSHSLPYSTPLGPLSPYGPSSSHHTGLPQHMHAMGAGGYSPSSTPPSFHSSGPQSAFLHGPPQRISSQGLPAVPGSLGKVSPSPTKHASMFGAVLASPVDKSESSAAILRDELRQSQQSLASWQDSWRQAKAACEAWKKEAEEVAARARMERESSRRRIDELERQLQETHLQLAGSTTAGGGGVDKTELMSLPLSRLEGLRHQLRRDLDLLDSSIQQRKGALCLKCQEFLRCVLTQPCQHCVLCEKCAESMDDAHRVCPYCQERITHCSTVLIPL
jgi:hypothetical protein